MTITQCLIGALLCAIGLFIVDLIFYDNNYK